MKYSKQFTTLDRQVLSQVRGGGRNYATDFCGGGSCHAGFPCGIGPYCRCFSIGSTGYYCQSVAP